MWRYSIAVRYVECPIVGWLGKMILLSIFKTVLTAYEVTA